MNVIDNNINYSYKNQKTENLINKDQDYKFTDIEKTLDKKIDELEKQKQNLRFKRKKIEFLPELVVKGLISLGIVSFVTLVAAAILFPPAIAIPVAMITAALTTISIIGFIISGIALLGPPNVYRPNFFVQKTISYKNQEEIIDIKLKNLHEYKKNVQNPGYLEVLNNNNINSKSTINEIWKASKKFKYHQGAMVVSIFNNYGRGYCYTVIDDQVAKIPNNHYKLGKILKLDDINDYI